MNNGKFFSGFSFSIFLLITSCMAQALEGETISKILASQYTLHSDILDEDRQLLIRLPSQYLESDKYYPVIYVLDAETWFEHAANSSAFLQRNNRIPENIVVGIPNRINPPSRGRDMAEQADTFSQFIEQEVFEFMRNNFRTGEHRTLIGHSASATYVMRVLATRPELFDNYIAASPWVNVDIFEGIAEHLSAVNFEKSVYFTLTNIAEEGEELHLRKDNLVELFESSASTSLNWRYDFIADISHFTTPYPTIFEGLAFSFYDYTPTRFANTDSYLDFGGLKEIENYYAQRSRKYSVSSVIPDHTLVALTTMFIGDKQLIMAKDILEEYVAVYPENLNLHRNLSIAYTALNQPNKSLAAYEQVVAIATAQRNIYLARYEARLVELRAQLVQTHE